MTRTQIQLPDDLYRRAKTFARQRELSLAEMTRRGLELFLARFPDPPGEVHEWQLPRINAGGTRVPLAKLHDLSADEETMRAFPRK